MDFEYSPHRSAGAGGAFHLLSPTHPQYSIDAFPSIRQIRRSLSRSPSKPSRFHLLTTKSPNKKAPNSPLSPSGLSRMYSAGAATEPSSKYKFSLRRNAPIRAGTRKTSPTSSLRRALSDGFDQLNKTSIAPVQCRSPPEEQENAFDAAAAYDEEQHEDEEEEEEDEDEDDDLMDMSGRDPRFELDNEPIKFDLLKACGDRGSSTSFSPSFPQSMSPAKSSPLKRSDGVMNLDHASMASPRVKRRSLHGAAALGDFDIFDQGFDGSSSTKNAADGEDLKAYDLPPSFVSPARHRSPQRRAINLRKSTLQQRMGSPKPNKLFAEAPDFSAASAVGSGSGSGSPSMPRTRSRMSLDGALPFRGLEPTIHLPPPEQRPVSRSAPKPHPLSKALSPSSSASSLGEDTNTPQTVIKPVIRPFTGFSKSLPIGAMRPKPNADADAEGAGSQASNEFETPEAYKMAKPLPAAFMSTGLISKRNRNVDHPSTSFGSSLNMPDTPSKKTSLPHLSGTPAPASGFGKFARPQHEFGSPTTPWSPHAAKHSPESFGKGVNIFGSRASGGLNRRASFLSVTDDELQKSPSGGNHLDAHLSNDDMPPTPTKANPASNSLRPQSRGKGNSLRSSLFGRRPSLAPEMFAAPLNSDSIMDPPPPPPPPPTAADTVTPSHHRHSTDTPSTPHESYTPPDPSGLSISGEHRGPIMFNMSGSNSFPPATPTGPREGSFNFSQGLGTSSLSGFFGNDVDTTLTSRFTSVQQLGFGEFSQVYKVERPVPGSPADRQITRKVGNVWAVKKSKKPYLGAKDRERKLVEVEILKALRGNEHIIEYTDMWESKNHLYIQTEFCENGNLKDFLTATGFKGRLDDFRIWKIMLELSQGVKCIHDAMFIHLDLKPANILIDWEGVLKIADFGMASSWPAPHGIEGEGDREYIGPEVLSGRFDKPADVFSLGMIMCEIAGNIVLPDNGTSWQRLRSGDMSDLPSLTFSSESTLPRDRSGDPVLLDVSDDNERLIDDDLGFTPIPRRRAPPTPRKDELVEPPSFMSDPDNPETLDKLVQWMIIPDPDQRPVIDQILNCGGVQWVEQRRRAGATVYEGNWGPSDDVVEPVLGSGLQDVEMLDI